MTLERAGRALEVQPWPEFPVNEGALCRKGWTAAGLRGHRERLTTPLVRDRATGELRGGGLGRGARPRRRPAARAAGDARRRRGRGLRRRRADQREGLPARQVRPGRARHQPDRLQRPLVHVVGRVRRQPGVRPRPRAAVPARRRRADRRARAGRLQPRRDDAAGRAAPRPAPRARRPGRRHRPAPHRPPPTGPTCSSSRCPAPTSRSRSACCTCSTRPAPSTRSTSPRRTTGFDDGPPLGRRRGGPSGSSGSPASPAAELRALADAARRRRPGHGADRPRRRAAQPGHRHRARPGSTSRSRSGMRGTAVRRLRLPHRPGQRPGRPRARPEGRPAARLPDDRRPGRPRARRRGLGRRPRSACRARGARRTSCSTRSAPRRPPGAAGLRQQHRRLRAERRRTSPARLAALDLLVVADIVLSRDRGAGRRRAAGHPVGRGDRHHDQPRGPGDPAPAGGRAAGRRAQRPRRARRAGRAARLAGAVRRPTPRRSSPSCGRASAGGPADYAGITYDRIRDEHGVFWPCPAPDHPGTPRMFADSFATPDGRARFVARRAPRRRPSRRATRLPAAPDHRPGARAVPVRRPDPAGPRPARRPGRSSSCTRCSPTGSAPSTASRSWSRTRRGELDGAGPGGRPRSGRTRCSCRSTGSAPTGSPTTRSTRPAGCRSSRCAPRAVRRIDAPERLVVVGNGMAADPAGRGAARRGHRRPTSPCSATSRTRRTTGSCCPRCSRAPTPRDALSCATRRGTPPRRRPAARRPGPRGRPRPPRGRCWSTATPGRRTTGWCWPPAASRRCRRSAGWSGSTAGCTTQVHAFRSLDDCRPPRRGAAARRAPRGRRRRRAARPPGRPGAGRPRPRHRDRRGRRAPAAQPGRTPRPARSSPATCAGSAPRSTPAPARSG